MALTDNIALAEKLGLQVQWEALLPTHKTSNIDFSEGTEVPTEVVASYKGTKGLGKRVASQFNGRAMVRTNPENGKVYILPKN